jgi:hypothetical protein
LILSQLKACSYSNPSIISPIANLCVALWLVAAPSGCVLLPMLLTALLLLVALLVVVALLCCSLRRCCFRCRSRPVFDVDGPHAN